MQGEDRPPDPYAADELRDAEVAFDLIAYMRDHPIAVGVIIVAIIVFFLWYMRGRKRR